MAKVEFAAGGWYAVDDVDGATVDEVNENLGVAAGGGDQPPLRGDHPG